MRLRRDRVGCVPILALALAWIASTSDACRVSASEDRSLGRRIERAWRSGTAGCSWPRSSPARRCSRRSWTGGCPVRAASRRRDALPRASAQPDGGDHHRRRSLGAARRAAGSRDRGRPPGSSALVGLVVGLAAQRPLANFVAGVVIAFTQPLRLGDQVTVDDVEGIVEEIGLHVHPDARQCPARDPERETGLGYHSQLHHRHSRSSRR